MSKKEQIAQLMQERKVAYTQTFQPDSMAGKAVIEDLGRFCRQHATTFHPDERVHCLLEGRREVVLRIHDFLTLSVDDLCNKYGGPQWQEKQHH